jgi:hypothetical protein
MSVTQPCGYSETSTETYATSPTRLEMHAQSTRPTCTFLCVLSTVPDHAAGVFHDEVIKQNASVSPIMISLLMIPVKILNSNSGNRRGTRVSGMINGAV